MDAFEIAPVRRVPDNNGPSLWLLGDLVIGADIDVVSELIAVGSVLTEITSGPLPVPGLVSVGCEVVCRIPGHRRTRTDPEVHRFERTKARSMKHREVPMTDGVNQRGRDTDARGWALSKGEKST